MPFQKLPERSPGPKKPAPLATVHAHHLLGGSYCLALQGNVLARHGAQRVPLSSHSRSPRWIRNVQKSKILESSMTFYTFLILLLGISIEKSNTCQINDFLIFSGQKRPLPATPLMEVVEVRPRAGTICDSSAASIKRLHGS